MVIELNINYPNNIKKERIIKNINYGNRGMTLESDINDTNNYYLINDIAVIYKKPTPIQVLETKDKKIVNAFYKEPSTTDYNGIYKGKYIDFEAKETTSKTCFPISNIHNHQIKHIERIINHNGIVFLIVRFTKLDETFLLFGEDFIEYMKLMNDKSISLDYFRKKGHKISFKLGPKVDYLEIIDKMEDKYGKEK